MPSLWRAETELQPYPPLEEDAAYDLVVVGSGIAGLSSAYEAARLGAKVVVFDRGDITGGMTARTTAHLSSEIDDTYSELIGVVGEEQARLYHESQIAAINRVEAVCEEERIDADFKRLPGYLVAARGDDQQDLEGEYDACRKLDVEVEWTDRAPIPLPEGTRALKFAHQAVPAYVLSAALFARFRSRVDTTFGDKLLSAMRYRFGGHVEIPQRAVAAAQTK